MARAGDTEDTLTAKLAELLRGEDNALASGPSQFPARGKLVDVLVVIDGVRVSSAEDAVNSKLREQPYGFVAYIRRAFEQKQKFNRNAVLDFYANPQRKELEASAIAYLKGERGQ